MSKSVETMNKYNIMEIPRDIYTYMYGLLLHEKTWKNQVTKRIFIIIYTS